MSAQVSVVYPQYGIIKTNYRELVQATSSNRDVINFCKEAGLLFKERYCARCHSAMNDDWFNGNKWRCSTCGWLLSVNVGTVFENRNITKIHDMIDCLFLRCSA